MVGLLLQAGYFGFTWRWRTASRPAAWPDHLAATSWSACWLRPSPASASMRGAGPTLGVLGAGLVIVAKASVDLQSAAGLAYAVAAAVHHRRHAVWRHGTDTHPVVSNLVQYSVGLLVTAPLAVWLEPMRVEWTGALFGSLAYLVVGNSLVAISLLLAMLRHGGPRACPRCSSWCPLLRRDRLCRAGRGNPGAGLAGHGAGGAGYPAGDAGAAAAAGARARLRRPSRMGVFAAPPVFPNERRHHRRPAGFRADLTGWLAAR